MGHHLVDFGGAMVLPSNLATRPKAAFRKTQHPFHLSRPFSSGCYKKWGDITQVPRKYTLSGTCGTFPM